MPDYKEQTVTGVSWQRCCRVVIDNPVGQIPQAFFYEEEVVNLPSGQVKRHLGQMVESFSDPSKMFDLINPATGDIIGSATYQDLYILLHSLYMSLAHQRDNQPILTVEPTP